MEKPSACALPKSDSVCRTDAGVSFSPVIGGYSVTSAAMIISAHKHAAIMYSQVQDKPCPVSHTTSNGPMMAPTPKKPSTAFMRDV